MKNIFKNKNFKVVWQFLAWRIWLFLSLFLAILFVPFREGSLFTTIWGYASKYSIVENPLVYSWSNFDGVHYLATASRGYIDEGRFLPLFPFLIRVAVVPFSLFWKVRPFGHLVFWSGLFLSNLFFILSLVFLKKLLKLDYSEKFANKVILLLLVFPTSFFFVSIYTESLFLLLSILVLFFARKKKWGLAILFSSFLSVTRLPGILILFPLLYEYAVYELKVEKKLLFKKLSKNWSKFIKFLIIPVPLLLHSLFNYFKWGDALYFINAHASLGNSREVSSIIFPLVTVYRYLEIFFTVSMRQYEFWVAVLEFLSLVLAVFGITFAYLKKVRVSYLLFGVVLILLPLLSGTLTGFPRYMLLAFPIFVGLVAKIEEGDEKKKNRSEWSNLLWKVTIVFSLLLQALLLGLFARGWFVG